MHSPLPQLLMTAVMLLASAVASSGADDTSSDSPPSDKQIKALIKALDDDEVSVRQDATRKLVEIGHAAYPALSAASEHGSLESRSRAAAIIKQIQVQAYFKEIEQLAKTKKDADIDLEQGMWLIARIETPGLERKAIDKQFDKLAAEVRKKLGKDVDPTKIAPQKVINTIRQIIFTDHGFTGDEETYRHPDNSLIHRVLKRKKGLPILLSHVVVAVADRLKVPVVGLQIPGRYMVKYDGQQAPSGQPRHDIIIDPFGAGRILTEEELSRVIGMRVDPKIHLQPSPKRDTLIRMLYNIETHYYDAERPKQAQAALRMRLMLQSSAPKVPQPSPD